MTMVDGTKEKEKTMGKITMQDMEAINKINPTAYAELCRKAFEVVANPSDWKEAIDKEVRKQELDYTPEVICHAVSFMTATECFYNDAINFWRFYAKGYRRGPAGDR